MECQCVWTIGDLFGGLLEVNQNTSNHSFFQYAKLKLKVKGSRNDYFNSSFDFCLNGKTYILLGRNSTRGGAFSSHDSFTNESSRTMDSCVGGGKVIEVESGTHGDSKKWVPTKIQVKASKRKIWSQRMTL